MLDYQTIKQFAEVLTTDQAPTFPKGVNPTDLNSGNTTQTCTNKPENLEFITAFEEKRGIHSITFEVAFKGEVNVRCHVQPAVLEQLLINNIDEKSGLVWSSYGPDHVHLTLVLKDHRGVIYTSILDRHDLKEMWEKMHSDKKPFPINETAEQIWTKLYNRGVWNVV